MAHRETLISWLNDAYSTELALIPVLENHAKDAKDHPAVQARIQEHAEETRRHAEIVKECLQQLGESPSSGKSLIGSLFGQMQAPMTGMFSDELVKNNIKDFAAEHFEIASYESLIAACEDLGETQIAARCQEILRDEKNMAAWLAEQLPVTTKDYLRHAAQAHTS